jgi:hypothetical protein
MRQREKEEVIKEENEYEERMRRHRTKERDRAYRQVIEGVGGGMEVRSFVREICGAESHDGA